MSVSGPPAASGYAWHRFSVLLLVLTTALRLSQLSSFELAPDEAYYWEWSRRPALGYYDQGPMIAYIIRATTALFGVNEFGVRIGVLACALGAVVCAYILARRLFSPLAGFITVLFLCTCPLLELGSLIATYDPPLVCFWALAAVFLERALFADSERERRNAWLLSGIATGLGFLSKHTMLLLLPCLLLFFLLAPAHRFWLRRPQPYLAFFATLALYSGVFWWNAHHHWWTFGHLLFLTHKSDQPFLHRLGDYLGSQAVLVGPGLFLGALAAAVRALRGGGLWPPRAATERLPFSCEGAPCPEGERIATSSLDTRRRREQAIFLACVGLPVFAFFCVMTLKSKVQGNWAVCAWVTPTVLLAGWLGEWSAHNRRGAARVTGAVAATGALLTALLASPALRYHLGVRLPPGADTSNTAYGWRMLARRVARERDALQRETGRKVFIAANGYQYAALMAFYLPDHPAAQDLFIHNRLTMYAAYEGDLKAHLGEDAIYVNDNRVEDAALRYEFEQVSWQKPLSIYRRPLYPEPIHVIEIARCRRYRHYMGLKWAEGG